MKLLSPHHWKNYQLLDSGNFEKLEKFGEQILSRPEPQAVWDKNLTTEEWEKIAHASFKKDKNNPEKGKWITKKGFPEYWFLDYHNSPLQLRFKLSLSSFKHVGLFPEQAVNWDYIMEKMKLLKHPNPRVLNLFAYTGGASLAAKVMGADVVHVDSVKPVVSWARENMEASELDNIRWVVEDAFKFVKREVKRGNIYQGIILDPPAYGRGPSGEKWILEESINELLKLCNQLLDKQDHFFILNLYSMGFSPLIVENLVSCSFENILNPEFGELFIEDQFRKKLPLGIFHRFSSK